MADIEVVLDYQNDQVLFDGIALPFPLSTIDAAAKVTMGMVDVTLVLHVDKLSTTSPPPPPPAEPLPEPMLPEEFFEQQLQRIRAKRGG
jgi:hypothetical protein